MTKDPVCHVDVDERRARERGLIIEQNEQLYYFCSEDCKRRFNEQSASNIVELSEQIAPDGQTNERYAG